MCTSLDAQIVVRAFIYFSFVHLWNTCHWLPIGRQAADMIMSKYVALLGTGNECQPAMSVCESHCVLSVVWWFATYGVHLQAVWK